MSESQELKRVLGMGSIFAVSVGLVCASSTLVSNFNGFGIAGPAFIISLIIAFGLNLLVVLSFSELATMFPQAGGIYQYTKEAFTRGKAILSTGVGTTYWGMMGFVFAAEIGAGAWALQHATGVGSLVSWILFITITCCVINLLGIQLAAWVEMLLVIFMIIVRVGFGLIAAGGATQAGKFDWGLIANFAPFGWGAVFLAIPLAFWLFVGLEFAVPLVEETIDPERNLPWGMILGILAILFINVAMGLGVVGVLDPVKDNALLVGNSPQIDVGMALLGKFGLLLMGIASFTASMGSVNVAFASIPRIAYAMAREGLWPKIFAYVHPKYKTPWAAIFLTFILFTIGPMLWNDVVYLINASAFIWLLIYLWSNFLVVKFKIDRPNQPRPFNNHILVPVFGVLLIAAVEYFTFKGAWDVIGIGIAFMCLCFIYAAIWTSFNNQKIDNIEAKATQTSE
ncbi:APC family permease [Desulfallas sp. Bu1-1]|uniref:APC family permease n=1 Tax=Desulfallas sp. Bu1-1 TaxID=2787620 RepID=UPI00189CE2F2|nr:APC family permease [Desulfallas sp. Bu1-1]MBF7082573.1 APC family permease [Desulfallas sp. Bu1-1]